MAPRSRFIGRVVERARLGQLLAAVPLVTLTGPGGVGKTRLALEIAGDATVIELADLPIDADMDAICGEAGFESPEAAAVALRERGGILVLDNCEHVLDGARTFAERLTAGEHPVRVLATSRAPLGASVEHVVVLEPLYAALAAELFLDRAEVAGASWDRSASTLSAVDDLCLRLDGLPLAIELAAARSRAFAPATLLQHIDDRLDVLRGVSVALDVSVDLLDDEQRRAFATLGVFAGSFDVDLAHAVLAGADRLHVIDLLAHLVDRSLVVAAHNGATTRYRLLELVRDHAVALLGASGDLTSARDRFVDAMTAEADRIVVEGVAGWTGELLARVETHLRNLFAAIDWCVEHDVTPVRAHRLLLPLFVACHQSRSTEVLASGERLLARWPSHDGDGRAEALAVLATAAVVSGNPVRAIELGQLSAADPSATELATLVAERAMAFAARGTGDYQRASEHLARGRVAASALGAQSFGRELAGFEGSVLDLQGRSDDALHLVAAELDEAMADGDTLTEAWLRLVATAAHARAGRWDDARAELAAAHAAAMSASHPWWAGSILRMQAAVANVWSPERWAEALESGIASGSVGEVALTLRAAAAMAAHHGMDDVADELLDAAPWSRELTVLPELFPEAVRRLEQRRPLRPPPPDLPTAVARGRAILARDVTPVAASSLPALHRVGDSWSVTFADKTVLVRDLKGIADLARLLGAPGAEVHCLELVGGSDLGGAGPALDERARREYEVRIRDLQGDIDEARAANDPGRAERAELELDALVEQLTDAFGLGGRSRATGSAAERARSAVTARVRAAIRRVAEVHPELGRHLDNAVRTGTWCSYRPESALAWSVSTA